MGLIRLALFFFITLFQLSCAPKNVGSATGDSGAYLLNGYVQKGPFVLGSEVKIQELDENLTATGTVYITQTTNNLGEFEFDGSLKGDYAEVIITGYYFDEIDGSLSNGPLTLRAIIPLKNEKGNPNGNARQKDGRGRTVVPANVNILTTLQQPRLKKLIQGGSSFTAAYNGSASEVLSAFGIATTLEQEFSVMSISSTTAGSAELLAVSSNVLQIAHNRSASSAEWTGKLSEAISAISTDLQLDGTVNSPTYTSAITEAKDDVDVGLVRSNLTERYADLGMTVSVPNFSEHVTNLWSLVYSQTEGPSGMSCIESTCYLLGLFNTFRKIDLSSLTVTNLPALPFNLCCGYARIVAVGSKLYFPRYTGSNNEMWEYDTINQTWTQKASASTNHQHAWASAVYNNKIYVFGDNDTSVAEMYDPVSNIWSSLPSLSRACQYPTAIAYENLIYVAGRALAPMEIFDPATETYSNLAISNPAVANARNFQILSSLDGKLYITTGDLDFFNRLWTYTPSSNIWAEISAPPLLFDPKSTHLFNGKFYVLSGGSIYSFDPSK